MRTRSLTTRWCSANAFWTSRRLLWRVMTRPRRVFRKIEIQKRRASVGAHLFERDPPPPEPPFLHSVLYHASINLAFNETALSQYPFTDASVVLWWKHSSAWCWSVHPIAVNVLARGRGCTAAGLCVAACLNCDRALFPLVGARCEDVARSCT